MYRKMIAFFLTMTACMSLEAKRGAIVQLHDDPWDFLEFQLLKKPQLQLDVFISKCKRFFAASTLSAATGAGIYFLVRSCYSPEGIGRVSPDVIGGIAGVCMLVPLSRLLYQYFYHRAEKEAFMALCRDVNQHDDFLTPEVYDALQSANRLRMLNPSCFEAEAPLVLEALKERIYNHFPQKYAERLIEKNSWFDFSLSAVNWNVDVARILVTILRVCGFIDQNNRQRRRECH